MNNKILVLYDSGTGNTASKGSTHQIVRLACVCERQRAFEFAQLQDDGTMGRQDHKTTGPRDYETTGLRDHGTTRPRDYETIVCRVLTKQYSGNTVHTKPLTARPRPCIFRP